MKVTQILALVLVALGILALIYGGFSYTSETHETTLGAFSLSMEEREYISVPVWAGAAAIVVGVVWFLAMLRRR